MATKLEQYAAHVRGIILMLATIGALSGDRVCFTIVISMILVIFVLGHEDFEDQEYIRNRHAPAQGSAM